MLANYIKIAWKVLLRHPFYTFITLFGISLTLTVLMVLTSFLDHLFGSHYPETSRYRSLYIQQMIQRDSARTSRNGGPMSFKFLTQYAKSLKTPERVSISTFYSTSNAYVGSRRIKLNTKFTDADFWQVTDFEFLEGKPYNEQTIAGGDHVAVITDDFKRQYFDNLEESAVGKDIEIENLHYKVIGVVKGSPVTRIFTYADVYFPYTAPKSNYQRTGFRGDYVAILLAKNKQDVPVIRTEFQDRINRIPMPAVSDGFKFDILEVPSEPYVENFIGMILDGGAGLRMLFFSLIAFILFMLLGLPAINLVNVNVSRIWERASEIGIRKAFGAPVRTLVWQFIVENVFITFIGGAIALILSFIIIKLINASGWIAYADLTINLSVFLVSVLVCLVFGLLSGVLPALRMSKLSIAEALKS
ncbi:ABC transporter permease [Spirosoma utsteinense]|uniref:ABC transport system permease protein n=1 Tax=Spirosoma utsteinense TaxID=2585773 RepID=A0ABR6W332_9BACT|nr:ABC transporter permease [Spirosoma utsteinense]MBC3786653.1 putative ABC transport system permease protein [Spirosoma utsteinense]MBC3791016.1 putative ABC transport system permease protein [Spirosoma utsteinense]